MTTPPGRERAVLRDRGGCRPLRPIGSGGTAHGSAADSTALGLVSAGTEEACRLGCSSGKRLPSARAWRGRLHGCGFWRACCRRLQAIGFHQAVSLLQRDPLTDSSPNSSLSKCCGGLFSFFTCNFT